MNCSDSLCTRTVRPNPFVHTFTAAKPQPKGELTAETQRTLNQVCSRAALARVHPKCERGLKPRDYMLDFGMLHRPASGLQRRQRRCGLIEEGCGDGRGD